MVVVPENSLELFEVQNLRDRVVHLRIADGEVDQSKAEFEGGQVEEFLGHFVAEGKGDDTLDVVVLAIPHRLF